MTAANFHCPCKFTFLDSGIEFEGVFLGVSNERMPIVGVHWETAERIASIVLSQDMVWQRPTKTEDNLHLMSPSEISITEVASAPKQTAELIRVLARR